jgi:hypothetical protein
MIELFADVNWWAVSCIASGGIALIIGFVLGCFYLADRAAGLADYERQLARGDADIDQLFRNGARSDRPARDFERLHSNHVTQGSQRNHG